MDDEIALLGDVNFLERDKEHIQAHGLTSQLSSEIKPKELRLLLIGKTGDGKSATANTILEREEFESGLSAESITQRCQFGKAEYFGRKLVVVDTPGLCDTTFPPEVIKRELIRSVGYSSPGFHAIIFVLAAGKYTEECLKVRDQFFNWFGEDARKYSLILITRGDEIKVEKRASYLQKVPKGLDEFMESCDRRVLFFNNRASGPESEEQIRELIEKIDEIIIENEGRYFSNIAFRLAKTYERISNAPVYHRMVKGLQARGTGEQTKRKTDHHQALADADSAIPMVAEHNEVHASSSKTISASDELLEEIIIENEGRDFSNIAFRLEKVYERISNTPVYQRMVKELQARGTGEQTKRKTDHHQALADADSAIPMVAKHDEVHASSSKTISTSDELLEEIFIENEGRDFSNIAFRLAKTYERISNTPVYQRMVKELQARATGEQTKRKTDHHQFVLEEQPSFAYTDDHTVTTHDTKPLKQCLLSASTCDTNLLETEQRTKTSHDTNPFKDMADDRYAEEPKLRDRIKKPGLFETFARFLTRGNDLYNSKKKTKAGQYNK